MNALPNPHNKQMRWQLAALGLVLLGFVMRVYQLNDVAVEKAEMTNIMWFIRNGLVSVLTQNKALNNHPLNSVLGYAMSAIGVESLFTLRWHSVVMGVLAVAVTLRVARDWLGRREALVAGLLITVSAYHVLLSQRARSYIGMVTFTLLGFFFIYRAVQTGQKRFWLGFAVVSVLNIYAHLYGAMAVGVLGLLAMALLLEKHRPGWRSLVKTLLPLAASGAAAYLVALGLYLPMWRDTTAVAGQSNIFSESDERHAAAQNLFEQLYLPVKDAIRPFSLADDATRLRLGDPDYHYSPFDDIAALAENSFGYNLALLSFGVGLIFGWRKLRWRLLFFVSWLVLPFIVQFIGNFILPGAYFRGRFISFIYPPFLLITALGWPNLADWLATRVTPHRRALRWPARSVSWLGIGLLMTLNLAWLGAFYTATANEHWVAIGAYIAQNKQPNDVMVCGQRSKTACAFDVATRTNTEAQEFADLITPANLQKKRAELEQPGRVWVVMPHLLPWQINAIRDKISPENFWLAGNPRYDQAGWWLVATQPTLGDNLAAALELGLAAGLNDNENFKNQISLAQLQLTRNRLPQAETAFAAAAKLLPPNDDYATERFTAVSGQLKYARQATQAIAMLPPTAIRLDKNYGDLARLAAIELAPPRLTPGATLQVTLYWLPLAPINRELVSFVHLANLKAEVLAQANGVPDHGQAPTTTWQPGQIIVDTYSLPIDAKLMPPLAVNLEAGLFAPANSQFIAARTADAQPTDSVVAKLTIATPQKVTPPESAITANFDNQLALAGYQLKANPPEIVFYWQPLSAPPEDFTVFVHLLNANGELAGQIDGQPYGGNYPTSWWTSGETVVDARPMPALSPGEYQIVVGWYRPADGSRLPLANGSGDSLKLSQIRVP